MVASGLVLLVSSASLVGPAGARRWTMAAATLGTFAVAALAFRTGKAAVEKSFDAELRGQPGSVEYEVDAHGRVVRELAAPS